MPSDPRQVKYVSKPKPVAAPSGTPKEGGADLPVLGKVGGSTPQWYAWTVTRADGTIERFVGPTQPDQSGNAPGAQSAGTDRDPEVTKDWQAQQKTEAERERSTGPGTVPQQQAAAARTTSADASQTRADATSAYDQAREAWMQGTLNRQNLATEAQIYNQRLATQVALGQLTEQQRAAQMKEWQSGVEAAQNERRIAIESQNANTSAGNLGVNRGQLGVSQENADTQREQVVQTAAQNAVTNTLELMKRFMPLNGGADDGFLKNYTAGINKMGGTNYAPSDFVSKPPDLQAISQQAALAAVNHMKGISTPAPATQVAITNTQPPAMPAPAAVPPPPALTPQTPAAQILAGAGPPPAPMPQPPPPPPQNPGVLPTYTGPPGRVVAQ